MRDGSSEIAVQHFCDGKRCYSYADAHSAINNAHKRHYHTRRKKKIPQRAYFCETCKQWHLTSNKYNSKQYDN